MTHEERQQLYFNILQEEGFRPNINEDGDIAFNFEGQKYCLFIDAEDEIFFNLARPSFFQIPQEGNLAKIQRACQDINDQFMAVKVYPTQDYVWAVLQQFYSPPENFNLSFKQCLNSLKHAVDTFFTNLNNE